LTKAFKLVLACLLCVSVIAGLAWLAQRVLI
jgi:hypothetical protein